MNRVLLSLGTIAWISSNTIQIAAAKPLTEKSRLSINGIEMIRVGMTVAQAQQAANRSFAAASFSDGTGSCGYVDVKGVSGVSFMLNAGKIVRIDIDNPRIMTLGGAKIGDSEARIKQIYPGIKSTRHEYVIGGHYLTFYPKDAADRNYLLIFETAAGKVTRFRSGKIPDVAAVEGCS
jgi:hypothetical protein